MSSSAMKKILCGLILLLSFNGIAQKQACVWYFGEEAGLDFNNCEPVALTDGALSQLEGCASIADSNGDLLFYTDGVTVYNADHAVMPNGSGLWGSPSSSQSAIIVPNPIDTSLYYIFTVANNAGQNGMAYSIVDMDLNGGLGDLLPGEKNIPLSPLVAEKLTAVYHADNESIWVIAHELDTNNFLSYLVTGSGINPTPVISSVGDLHLSMGIGTGAIGCIKASPNGKKLACAKGFMTNGLELFDFDNTSGVISNPMKISTSAFYGVEFSPDSQLLYSTSPAFAGKIYQYDITLLDLAAVQQSQILIASSNKYATLQLAVNGKIYAAQTDPNGSPVYNSLSVINNPNTIGVACDFQENAVALAGKFSRCGLPPFNQSYFRYEMKFEGLCFDGITRFEYITHTDFSEVNWDFGDPASGSENTAHGVTANHVFSAPGTYIITSELITSFNCPVIITQEITIYPAPEANQPQDLSQCGESVFDLTEVEEAILGPSQDPSDFGISYYLNLSDAEQGTSATAITQPESYIHENLTDQPIYVRISNDDGCYDLTSFVIHFNPGALVNLEHYDGVPVCVDLNPGTPVIAGNYDPVIIDTGLSENDYIFIWSLNGNTLTEDGATLTVNSPGEYSVTVTHVFSSDPNCASTSTATIIESNPPEFEVTSPNFTGIITIENITGLGNYEFSMDQDYWVDLGTSSTLYFRDVPTGRHLIYGRDRNGCGMTVMEIYLMDYMKFFTPNADGINDRWRIMGLYGQPEANLYIFDRYGKLLVSLNPNGPGWDGLHDGRQMPSTDYWFRLEYISPTGVPEVYQNHFSLVR